LHIGKEYVINNNDIIGIFNLDYIKNTKEYKKMYEEMEANKKIVNVSNGQTIKTVILTEKDGVKKIYLTNIGTNTILKRKK
jgi:regulator of extracellular matrix RemA (YlzA/DUF370 family)